MGKGKATVTFSDTPVPRRSIPKSSSAKQLFDKSSLSTVVIDNLGHKFSGSSNNNLNMMPSLPISPLATQTQSASDSDCGHSNATTALVPSNRFPRNDSSASVNIADVELQISRRPSVLLHELLATRRPSAVMATLRTQGYVTSNQRPRIMGSVQEDPDHLHSPPSSLSGGCGGQSNQLAVESRQKNRRIGDDALSTALSALYCKVLVILGVALPVTELITHKILTHIYQGFYVFLYMGSLAFVVFVYAVHMKSRALFNILKNFHEKANNVHIKRRTQQLGSFYLRVGAIAFGIGTMVYSGLEFGQFFELSGKPGCNNIFTALTPACRMALAIIQIQFIFLNTTELDIGRHKVVARFGLMHMIATNLCEWLYVLVEETKHEIFHLTHKPKSSPLLELKNQVENLTMVNASSLPLSIAKRSDTGSYVGCERTNIMGSLVQDSSPFLFPCTIEYSLICAVILYEMWKKVKSIPDIQRARSDSQKPHLRNAYHFSVDCSRAHKGMFAGIMITVLTIIGLIMYFVLKKQPGYSDIAVLEMTICEILMYSLTILAVVVAMIKVRDLRYLKGHDDHEHSMELDCTLLVLAQTGVYLYAMFSIMGSFYAISHGEKGGREGLAAEALGMIQASLQTLFILNSCKRKCKGAQQHREKPGRELVTFLLIANISIWFINTLVKGHASYRTSHNDFYGTWAWTIIVHVSMPLAIFYRFHSTICLFEVWKSAYKAKNHQHSNHH